MSLTARQRITKVIGRSIAPRKRISVSEWADEHRILSGKGSAEPGRWRTSRNPPLQEPMDAMSARSGVHEVVLRWPVQILTVSGLPGRASGAAALNPASASSLSASSYLSACKSSSGSGSKPDLI